MSKITLTDLVNLENQTTAVNAINGNNQTLETAFDNTLSRDGTNPNTMGAPLDMNSKPIVNLRAPVGMTEPVRLADLNTVISGGTIHAFPTGGLTGQSLVKNSNTDYDTTWLTIQPFFTPEQFGAVGNGVADDGPAINSAMAAANAAGGGTVKLGSKTYRIGQYKTSNGALITPYSNVCVLGDGPASIIKVGNGLNTGVFAFFVFYPPDNTSTYTYTNQIYKNFCIDFNGANNGGFAYNNFGIGINFGSNIVIDGVTFKNNPGGNNIIMKTGVDNYKIINTTHSNNGPLVNATLTDHSSIFSSGSNYTIANNIFLQPSQDTLSTAWEMWGSDGVAHGNNASKYSKCVNIAALAAGNPTTQRIVCSDNNFFSTQYGITLWCDAGSTLTDILISNNTFNQAVHGTAVSYHDFDSVVTAVGAKDIIYSNNIFTSSVASGSANAQPCLKLGRAINQRVSDNLFVGGLGPSIGAGTFTAVTNVEILNNKIMDCGQTSTAGSRRGILISSAVALNSFFLDGNFITNSSTAFITTGYDISLANATFGYVAPTNVVSNVATHGSFTLSANFTAMAPAGVVYAQSTGNRLTATSSAANSILVTDGSSVPNLSTTLPAHTLGGAVSGNSQNITGLGTVQATQVYGGTAVGTGSPTGNFIVNDAVANGGFNVFNGVGGVKTFLRWNAGIGGYIGVCDTGSAISTQIQGTGDSFIAAPAAGASLGVNTQVTPGSAAQTGNSKFLTMNGVIQHAKNTVANLPAASAALEGSRYGVTDANATFTAGIGAVVAGGGANHVPVYCDGTNWRIG